MELPRQIQKDVLLIEARDWFDQFFQGNMDPKKARAWLHTYSTKLEPARIRPELTVHHTPRPDSITLSAQDDDWNMGAR
jgi:hypothetical protein